MLFMSLLGDVGFTRQGTISTGADITLARNVTDDRRIRLDVASGSLSASASAASSEPRPSITASAITLRLAASLITRKAQGCVLPPLGARVAASIMAQIVSSGTGSSLNLRIERW